MKLRVRVYLQITHKSALAFRQLSQYRLRLLSKIFPDEELQQVLRHGPVPDFTEEKPSLPPFLAVEGTGEGCAGLLVELGSSEGQQYSFWTFGFFTFGCCLERFVTMMGYNLLNSALDDFFSILINARK